MIILGIIALIVIPPEKLPEVARQVARFISELKNSADQIMGELKQEAIFKPDDIIDKNIKQKLAELHRDINQTISLDKPVPPVAPEIPPANPPKTDDTPSGSTDDNKKS
jgi:sec-independent protein translocase protein TatB